MKQRSLKFGVAAVLLSQSLPQKISAQEPVDNSVEPKRIVAAGWLRADDFPSDAFKDGSQGQVRAYLSIDPSGRPFRCDVIISSASASLDKTSCLAALQRGKFYPARDRDGQAVFGIHIFVDRWMNPNSWAKPPLLQRPVTDLVLKVGSPLPTADEAVVGIKMVVESDGAVLACGAVSADMNKGLVKAACSYITQSGLEPMTDLTGAKVRSVRTLGVEFTTDEVAPPPSRGARFEIKP